LRVAILFDYVNAIVLLDEFMNLAGEGTGPQTQVIGFDGIFGAQLIAAFGYAPVRSSVGDDSDSCVRAFDNFRTRNKRARGFELAVEALHVVFVIVGALAVVRFVVVPAAAREVGGRGMLGAGQGAITHAVAV